MSTESGLTESASRPVVALAMRADLPDLLLSHTARARLAAVADIDLTRCIDDFDQVSDEHLGRVEVLLTSWGCPQVDKSVLDRMPRLRAVTHAAGTLKAHLSAAVWEQGVLVSAAAGVNALPVAEFTVAMILLAGKSVRAAEREFGLRRTEIDLSTAFPGIGNYHRTVGVIGASRVGRRVLDLLQPFDLDVLCTDPFAAETDITARQARLVPLPELLRTSDVVSLHAPALASTRHLLGAAELAMLRDGATLLNTARGSVIDPVALERELLSGRISAVLDVTDPEPLPADSPLWTLPNVILTPHVAGSLGNELFRLGDHAVAEVERFVAGAPFTEPVLAGDLDRMA
jgi:phosphoglycerate dehydrogenase-like enzyme